MAEKDIGLEKFCGTTAGEWTAWVDDYRIFGGLKKWNEEKLVSNLRFFVSGDVKDCVRQKCSQETPNKLEVLEKEVAKFLGGELDPISAVKELDRVRYEGSIEKLLLKINDLIPLAYPSLKTREDRDQMVLLQLHKTLPKHYTKEMIKDDAKTLASAKTLIAGMEKADRLMGEESMTLGRMVVDKDSAKVVTNPSTNKQCFVCGLDTHIKQSCPFKNDICGQCEKRGHLGTMCRKGNGGRPGNRSGPARGQWQARGQGPAPAPQHQRPQPVGSLQQHPWPPHPWSQHQWAPQWPQQLPHQPPQQQRGPQPTLGAPPISMPPQQQQQQLR